MAQESDWQEDGACPGEGKGIAQGSARLAEERRGDLPDGPYYSLPRSVGAQ